MKEKGHISLIIMMIALSLFGSYHIYYHFLNSESKDLVRNYYEEKIVNEEKVIGQKMNSEVKEEYLGVLRIPKINLIEGFYNIYSKNNDVNRSVTILKESVMPSSNGSIIYLTAHSGSGYLAYFKNLNKLAINDIIYLDIENNRYQYIVSDIYEVIKNGIITVNRNINEKYLVLSTCSNNKEKQLVIVCKLINNE